MAADSNNKHKTVSKHTRRHYSIKKIVPGIKTLSRHACPSGMIERKGYTRRYSTAVRQRGYKKHLKSGKEIMINPKKQSLIHVKAKCIKDKGLPGKGKPIFGHLRKGELSKYGYTMREPEESRHKALRKAVEKYGMIGVYRKLDAVAKLTTRTIPEASKIYEKDRDWVKKTFSSND